MGLLPPARTLNRHDVLVSDIKILLVYRAGPGRGVGGQTVGADGSGEFAVGFTGDTYEEADQKLGKFRAAMDEYTRTHGQRYEIISIVTDSWGREHPIAVDPPVSLKEALK